MPVVLRRGRLRFFFYSHEGSPREPPHVHVRDGADEAKLWLRPNVRLAYNDGLDFRALREAIILTEAHRDAFEQAWHEHFSEEP